MWVYESCLILTKKLIYVFWVCLLFFLLFCRWIWSLPASVQFSRLCWWVCIAACFLVRGHFEVLLVLPSVSYLQDLVFQLLFSIRESTFSPGFDLVLVFLHRCGLESVPAPKILYLLARVWLGSDFGPSPVPFYSGPQFDSLFLLDLCCRSRFFSRSIIFGPAS
jgi:hypothetical protein